VFVSSGGVEPARAVIPEIPATEALRPAARLRKLKTKPQPWVAFIQNAQALQKVSRFVAFF
jgi:hypothetical protein